MEFDRMQFGNVDKALVLSSGGIDSTTCLAMAVEQYGKEAVYSLSVYYGQKHKKELKAAENIAEYYGVEHDEINLSHIFKDSDCPLLDHSDLNVPHESYLKQQEKKSGTVSTYVPFRNGLFLSCAASIALIKGADTILYGAHIDDAAGCAYPDCSEMFNCAISDAIRLGSGGKLRVVAPFVRLSKAKIVRIGIDRKVPYELTWSCYEGGDEPCGRCGTCIDRAEAFAANGAYDPAVRI